MKKIVLALSAFISLVNINAQVTDTGSNVGIGTTTPSEKLHVLGNTRTNNLQLNGGNIQVAIPNTTGGWARGLLYYNPSVYSTDEIGGIGMFGSQLTPSRIFIGFGNDPWYSTKGIQITSNGFVGIGKTNPTQTFDVHGNASIGNNAWAALIINGKDKNDWMFNAHNDGNNFYIRTSEDSGSSYSKYIMSMNRNTGNIGIGTIAPEAKLEVKGDIQVRGSHGGNDGVFANLNFYNDYSSTKSVLSQIQGVRGINDFQKGNLSFRVKNGTELTEVLRLRSDGDMGIGTTNPQAKLHIKSNSGILLTTDDVTQDLKLFREGENAVIEGRVNNNLILRTKGNNATTEGLFVQNSNKENLMFINGAGNVGIGTTSPEAKLDVRGTERKGLRIYKDNFTDKYLSFWQGSVGAVIEPIKTNGGTSEMYLGGYDNPTNVYLSNKTGGKVGIGTTNIPSQFKLAVAGKMITEEVTVKLQSTWPDYVFTNEYKLPSLKEVEKQIKENGHLANIPSAEEVAKNGVELGEMNKKLLEKVEELTLYTIQQEKELEKQGKEIEELKALVRKLIDSKK